MNLCDDGKPHRFEMEHMPNPIGYVCTQKNDNEHGCEDGYRDAIVICRYCGGGWCVDCIPEESK